MTVIDWVYERPDLTPTQKFLLVTMFYKGGTSYVFDLHVATGMTIRTIRTAFKVLAQKGIVEERRSKGRLLEYRVRSEELQHDPGQHEPRSDRPAGR